jgi:hypothetical protein
MIVFLFGTALASAAFAQGRHDEKPHGSSKPSVSATDTQYEPMPVVGTTRKTPRSEKASGQEVGRQQIGGEKIAAT